MFAQRISETKFTKPYAESFFSKISGDEVCDAVLMSTLRALLFDKAEQLRVVYRQYDGSADATSINEHVSHLADTLSIVDTRHTGALSDELTKEFLAKNDGWERIERVSRFYKTDFQCLCFINKEIRNTILIVENLNTPKMHYMMTSIMFWFPWYISLEKREDMSDKMRNLLTSFREKTSDKFLAAIGEYEKDHDFYVMSLSVLDNFENAWKRSELSALTNEISSIERTLGDLYERITRELKRKEDKNIRLTGLQMYAGEDSHEILDYLRENAGRIRYICSDESSLQFEVLTSLMYYDADEAEQFCNNKRSLLYSKQRGSISSEDMSLLLKSIFINQQIRLNLVAQYRLEISEMRVRGMAHVEYSDAAVDFFPNTHIDHHACIGGYEQALSQAMECHNYVGAIEQCAVSAASLNFFDSTVMGGFMEDMYRLSGTPKKCFVLPDGTYATIDEAISFVKGVSDGKKEKEE